MAFSRHGLSQILVAWIHASVLKTRFQSGGRLWTSLEHNPRHLLPRTRWKTRCRNPGVREALEAAEGAADVPAGEALAALAVPQPMFFVTFF